ncbi:hypothetical protein SanaruYs_23760 [Chryseotalea sanaruensis]|uniref:PorZ N-terminal beta-propeller domain-containing protein n=1 Tax=Chryseotalea sanaruensis TaxID=2482724 RepID=A0A401UB81_9BACT|nr:two-component regulator propeller domain-containing protein [Chryseotalea sanaruensis]GCC52140.1 hypothetical protein SanaruYs_23760 [Chryseotalea sanaruensis]
MVRFCVLIILFFVADYTQVHGQQDIPLGTWRAHVSFNSVKFLVSGDSKIFAASENAVLQLDLTDQSFSVYSNLNALSTTGITAMAYDDQRDQLIVGYENGAIDFITAEQTRTYTRLVNPSDVTGSSSIRHMLLAGASAYLSTTYGVVVFDLVANEVRETWRNLGSSGQALAINQSALLNDSIYLATTKGVIKGRLNNNLLDFNQWQRYESGDFNVDVKKIEVIANRVVVGVGTKGIYKFNGNTWEILNALPLLNSYTLFNASGNTLFYGDQNRLLLTQDLIGVEEKISNQFVTLADALIIGTEIWLADSGGGLLKQQGDGWQLTIPNGPASPFTFKARAINNEIFTVHGGFTQQFLPDNSIKQISIFKDGIWSLRNTSFEFITDAAAGSSGDFYLSSFSDGIEKVSADGVSTLFSSNDYPLLRITALKNSTEGLWVSSYNSVLSLHLLKADNTISSFASPNLAGRYPVDMEVDRSGNVWMLLGQAGGGGVRIVKNDGTDLRILSDQPGGGLLPSREVLSIAVDKNDYVWIGTARGVAYYTFYSEDGIKPLVEGRFLLSEERITAIEVDAGNRKWIGTERGLWLFSDTGEEAIYNFTTKNSPLPSNIITDLELNQQSGELFITTDKGLVSFRSDATESLLDFGAVKIFPNPVVPSFSGLVGISNLMANAVVKIVDVSGRLINQIEGNGGAASWNLADYAGKRVSTGVYILICVLPDGSESFAGKLIVLD